MSAVRIVLTLVTAVLLILAVVGTHSVASAKNHLLRVDVSLVNVTAAKRTQTPLGAVNDSRASLPLIYLIGYWGYCLGNHTHISYCSPSHAGFRPDPLQIYKCEVAGLADNATRAQIAQLTYADLNVGRGFVHHLKLLNGAIVALFACFIIAAVLAVLLLAVGIIRAVHRRGPEKNTSVLLFYCTVLPLMVAMLLVACCASTAVACTWRKNINRSQWGLRASLLPQFEGILWSALALATLTVVYAVWRYIANFNDNDVEFVEKDRSFGEKTSDGLE